MLYGSQERQQSLPRESAAALRRKRQGKHDRQVFTFLLQNSLGSFQAGFHIERVERRLEQDDVHTAVHQSLHLLFIGVIQIHIGDSPEGGITHVRTHGSRLVGRTDRAGDEYRTSGMFRHKAIGHFARQPSGSEVYIAHLLLHAVVSHRDGIRIECVGSKDVRTGIQVLAVNGLDHIRAGDAQQVVIAFQVTGPTGKLLAAIVLLSQFKPLDHRSHSSVQNQNTFFQEIQKYLFIH